MGATASSIPSAPTELAGGDAKHVGGGDLGKEGGGLARVRHYQQLPIPAGDDGGGWDAALASFQGKGVDTCIKGESSSGACAAFLLPHRPPCCRPAERHPRPPARRPAPAPHLPARCICATVAAKSAASSSSWS